MTTETIEDRAIELAKQSATNFVNEFACAFNEKTDGDWDAVAWGEDRQELRLSSDESDRLWPIWQAAFIAETKRLMTA